MRTLHHSPNAFAFGSRLERTENVSDHRLHRNMVAEHVMNALIPLIMEELVEVIKVVLPERISERIREQIVDVHVPRAVEQVTEVAKTKEISVLAETIEEKMVRVETLAVEIEKMNSELFEATKMKDDLEADTAKHSSLLESAVSRSSLDGEVSSRDQILQCTVEQVLDVPVPEMVEVPKTMFQDKIQQRIVEQICKGNEPCTSYSRTFTIHNYGYDTAYTFTQNNIMLEPNAMNNMNTVAHMNVHNTQF